MLPLSAAFDHSRKQFFLESQLVIVDLDVVESHIRKCRQKGVYPGHQSIGQGQDGCVKYCCVVCYFQLKAGNKEKDMHTTASGMVNTENT
jgi:hypothetical protein